MGLLPSRDRELEEFASMAERPLLPGLNQDVQYFREYALGGGIVTALTEELNIGPPAGAAHDPAVEPPIAGDIEDRKIFCQSQWMPVWKGDASCAHTQLFGSCR